jgi:ATP-dependent RNA helicase DDX5/DBP2
MAKRGKRRRHQKVAELPTQPPTNNVEGQNQQRDDDDDSNKRPKTAKDSEHDDDHNGPRLEVSYHGQDQDSVSIPPPLDDALEEPKALFQIWKYLGSKKKTWSPTMIQRQLWSIFMQMASSCNSINMIGIAPTGSGKTLAYSIPTLLLSLSSAASNASTGILVLVPTRELVQQVAKVYTKVVQASKQEGQAHERTTTRVVVIHGGVDRQAQKKELQQDVEHLNLVVVATPGRLLDLLDDVKLPHLGWIVLDEADQLSKNGDLGPQVDNILKATRSEDTRLALLSATYPETAQSKFHEWVGSNHVLVQVDHLLSRSAAPATAGSNEEANNPSSESAATSTSPAASTHNSFSRIPSHLEQILHVCAEHKKPKKLVHTLKAIRKKKNDEQRNMPLGIVFFSRIEKLKFMSSLLEKEGVASVELHSQLSTQLRQTNLQRFSCGQCPLMLATDVAARGIDIPLVQFVIQYDFPGNLQQYVHRCGRAGRSGDAATIYSFFTRNLKAMAADLIQLLEANKAWVDPNLRELLLDNTTKKKKTNQNKPAKPLKPKQLPLKAKKETTNTDDVTDEDEDFPELAANRIVLKRAGHVSDASSSSDESSDEKV